MRMHWGQLYKKHHDSLLEILLSRGVDRTEADDLLADVWADCVPGRRHRPSMLKKFNGTCPLQDWLAKVATIRWVDRNPKRSRHNNSGPGYKLLKR
jgi:DNA-directed RNA polymerase specialized sigma24 family protein